jgi:putative nucleotidyltransferase with HDIG domain
LEIAYQATLEGWVRALDLRDKETEGHTQRVTTLTQRLARSIGVGEDDMVHITRGALLHDIGKMAIPDGILLKPGELTPEERMTIQQHPIYAYQMLNPIKFLRPALDIPYCHHEKWDGSGYPRGLKEISIPFAARIFSVVDVWDALIYDRPYRKGLAPSSVKKMITEKSGNHFDPRVVDAFFALDNLLV